MTPPDPLQYDVSLPIRIVLFPLGVQLELETNSAAVTAATAALWSPYAKNFDGPGIRLRVAVSDRDAPFPLQPEVPHGHEHLILTSHGPGNSAVCDLTQYTGFIHLTRDVAANTGYAMHHFVEPMVYFLLSARRFLMVHAAAVAWSGKAVLLCGDSGSGKTCLAWACARNGWTFLSGDATQIVRGADRFLIAGRPYSIRFRETARCLFPELEAIPAARGPAGKLDIEVDPAVLGAALSPQSTVSHVVFLRREDSGDATLEPVAFEDAFADLARNIFFGSARFRHEQRRALAEFLALPKLRLHYSDLGAAERLLRSTVMMDAVSGAA